MIGGLAARRFRRNRPAMLGLGIIAALVAFSVVGPLLSGHSPTASDFSLDRDRFGAPPGPSAAHWLGTDSLFRDELSRLAAGGRLSLSIAVLATLLATTLGTAAGVTAGMTAGTRARLADEALMRLVDVLLALPFLLFITAIGVAVGRADVGTILLVLGLTGWAGIARLVRAKTLQLRDVDFVTASRALGGGALHVVRRHVLPNIAGPLLVIASSSVAQMILAEAVLGYLTVGVQPPAATWGRMLHEGESFLGVRLALVAMPGLAILLAVLGWSRIGEGVRDAIDPRGDVALPSKRLPFDLLIVGAALLLLAVATPNAVRAPIGAAGDDAEPRRGGTLHVATIVNVRTLDPAVAYDEGVLPIEDLVFARLVTWDHEGKIAFDLARDVQVEDAKRYVFTLREGLHFHDGTPLEAADVKRSLERSLHPRTPCPGASHYGKIVGFDAYRKGKSPHLDGVRTVGDRVIEIELTEPDATFLALMTLDFAAPVCASSGDHVDPQHPAAPCGAGPFRVESFEPDTAVRLARFEGYHRPDRPYLDAIEWQLSVPARTQRYKFEDGALDYVRDLASADVALYRADPAWQRRGRWVTKKATTAIYLNTELAPFDSRDVRRAVAMAIDPSVLEKVRPDVATADRVLPASIPGPPRTEPMRRHDLPAALDAMARAGFRFDPLTGKGGWPHEIDYLTVPDSFEQQAGEVFQQQLAKIGIRIRLELATFASYQAQSSRRRASAMGWTGWNADFPDPANFFEPILTKDAIADEGSQNLAFFSNAELDQTLERARRESDRDRRLLLYERCEEIVRDEAPWIPVYHARSLELWQPYVRNYRPHAVLAQRFDEVWIDPDAARPSPLALLPRAP